MITAMKLPLRHGLRICTQPTFSTARTRATGRLAISGVRFRLTSVASFSGNETDPKVVHRMFEEQMLDLKDEREALFGFTSEDRQVWSNNASTHRHDQSFMDEINAARDVISDSQTQANKVDNLHSQWKEPHNGSPSVSDLSHVSDGESIQMVNISDKEPTQRVAVAQSRVVFPLEVARVLGTYESNKNELTGPKGPIFQTAKLAGILAAKKTSELIPLCHPLSLDYVDVAIDLVNSNVAIITCECRVSHRTGVEMEALVGASIAALTVYDMTKALSHKIRIEDTVLLSKTGGKRQITDTTGT